MRFSLSCLGVPPGLKPPMPKLQVQQTTSARQRRRFHLWILAITLPSAAAHGADPVLYIDDSSGRLGTVNIETGQVEVKGLMGAVMTDIAFAPDGVTLYGIDFGSSIWQINPQTAQSTFVGSTGVFLNALVFGPDGLLYAASPTTGLYVLDVMSGSASLLGGIGASSAGDLAFHQGTLYLSASSNQLVEIDQNDYTGTLIGPMGFNNVFGMATGPDDVLYGVAGTRIFRIDPLTGNGTLLLDYAGKGLGSANGTSFTTEAIPEMSSIALASLGLLWFAALRFWLARLSSFRNSLLG